MNPLNKQKGLSLIELMVTLLISSLLLLGVLQLFINTSATDRTSTELARVQETGRLVMELVAREARRAGYQGCVGSNVETDGVVHFSTPASIRFPADAIDGTDTSLIFTYVRPNAAGDFTNRDCANNPQEVYQISFSNCGEHLCMTDPTSGGQQQVAANTNFSEIRYVQSNCSSGTCSKTAADADMEEVSKIEVTLAVRDSDGKLEQPRTFTSLIELRNRL